MLGKSDPILPVIRPEQLRAKPEIRGSHIETIVVNTNTHGTGILRLTESGRDRGTGTYDAMERGAFIGVDLEPLVVPREDIQQSSPGNQTGNDLVGLARDSLVSSQGPGIAVLGMDLSTFFFVLRTHIKEAVVFGHAPNTLVRPLSEAALHDRFPSGSIRSAPDLTTEFDI